MRIVKKLCKKGEDGRYAPAAWFHEGDFGDDRCSSAWDDLLDNPTPGTVTMADGSVLPAMIDTDDYAIVEVPEPVMGG